jgi:sulfur-oxidizing protein SoxX
MKRHALSAACALVLAACAAPLPIGERPAVSESELADIDSVLRRDFRDRGIAKMDRLKPDAATRTCNLHADNPPEKVAQPVERALLAAIPFPAGSLMGDWKRGERLAQSGRGMTWSDKPGNNGGSCYNCHRISAQEESYGTLGPSLLNFGKLRGSGPDIQRYVYGKIYNSKAYTLCSHMPRMGASGTLTEQQIKDLVALLLDPASPINK